VHVPPVTADLVERLQAAVDAFGVARVEALAALPGNPLDLRVERFGGAVAPAACAAPDLDFVNRISCLRGRDADRLDAILAFYGGLGLRPWLEQAPGPELELEAATLLGFQTVLYGPPEAAREQPVGVREAADAAGAGRLIVEASGAPAEVVEPHGLALAGAALKSGGRLYVAELDGGPAAGAILTTHDRLGYLALAATLPACRGRGCQGALIAARIAAAAAGGCELVVATAAFASVSQRNLERAGLRVAYTMPVFRLTPRDVRARGATA
jgi:ribosomal protein S18 acetylase RimI-like enzyme